MTSSATAYNIFIHFLLSNLEHFMTTQAQQLQRPQYPSEVQGLAGAEQGLEIPVPLCRFSHPHRLLRFIGTRRGKTEYTGKVPFRLVAIRYK